MVTVERTRPEAERLLSLAHEALGEPGRAGTGGGCARHALLEGDFMLHSGRRSPYYLDKYRFETRPRVARGRSASASQPPSEEFETGAVRLAAAGTRRRRRSRLRRRWPPGLPFVIVREGGQGLRHRQPDRGGSSSRASSCACSRTSSPPAVGLRRRCGRAPRGGTARWGNGGLRCRPRGGRRGRSRAARASACARSSEQGELLSATKTAGKPHG